MKKENTEERDKAPLMRGVIKKGSGRREKAKESIKVVQKVDTHKAKVKEDLTRREDLIMISTDHTQRIALS